MFSEPVDLSAFKPKYPSPPSMHWFLMLALSWVAGIWLLIMQFTLFGTDVQGTALMRTWLPLLGVVVYSAFVLMQILWFRKVNPASLAYPLYLVSIAFNFVLLIMRIADPKPGTADSFAGIAAWGLYIGTNFVFRSELQRHYNKAEPIGLKLSGVMTFFFARYYFQYHFMKIARLKDEAAAIPAQPTT
jgi:hypothetical protein